MKDYTLATRVNDYTNKAVRALSRGLGLSISEYLRKLILEDLDSKQMFAGHLKKMVEQSETMDRIESPEDVIKRLWEQSEEEENHEDFW